MNSGLSVVIPTYRREAALVSTVNAVLEQAAGAEILVVDQSPEHTAEVSQALTAWANEGAIRWIRLARPSIPRAMNIGLVESRRSVVLFLDDDIVPAPGLLTAHVASYRNETIWAVAGQVLQPGQGPTNDSVFGVTTGLWADLGFRFNFRQETWVSGGMAGNLSVRLDRALSIGGFDERFVGVAYRFETDFCRRLCRAGGRILFQPSASIRHLKAPAGGIRVHGSHLTSVSPKHSVGDYYFALRQGSPLEALGYVVYRPFRAVRTRFHLAHPWFIPVILVGELLGLLWALRLACQKPALLARPARPNAAVVNRVS